MRNSQKKSSYVAPREVHIAPREMYIEVGIMENGERSQLLFMTLPKDEMSTSTLLETVEKNAPARD